MTLTQDQLGKIQARVLAKVGDPTKMQELDLSNKGLALCIIDSIESTGVRYGGVKKVLERDVTTEQPRAEIHRRTARKSSCRPSTGLRHPNPGQKPSATSTRHPHRRAPH